MKYKQTLKNIYCPDNLDFFGFYTKIAFVFIKYFNNFDEAL
jgi:hypothetical protein